MPAVQAHLDNKLHELRNLLKPDDIFNLTFTRDRGAAIIQTTLKTYNFDEYSADDHKLSGNCYKLPVWAFDNVDTMYSKMFHLIDLMKNIFPCWQV